MYFSLKCFTLLDPGDHFAALLSLQLQLGKVELEAPDVL